MNLKTFNQLSKLTEDEAREYLENIQWPKGARCPRCDGDNVVKLKPNNGSKTRPGVYNCRSCRRQFTVTVGTIYERSHIPIKTWLMATALVCASKKGISSHQIHRMLGITYVSALFLTHRIRYAMTQEPLAEKLNGTIEVGETYIGGKHKGGKRGARFRKQNAGCIINSAKWHDSVNAYRNADCRKSQGVYP